MAPIYGSQEFLDDLTIKVSPSVVLVKSFELCGTIHQLDDLLARKGKDRDRYIQQNMEVTHYKSCTGFIISVGKSVIYIAVHHSQIKPVDRDVISVRFHDNNEQAAKILIKKTKSLMILSVEQSDHPYRPVLFSETKIGRDNILILSNVGMSGLSSCRSSVVNPSTEAISNPADSDSIVEKSEKWFTFVCTANIEDLLGAPVFDFSGVFVGAVDTNHQSMWSDNRPSSDLIYARHVPYFIRKARKKIKEKLKKQRKKKKNKMGG